MKQTFDDNSDPVQLAVPVSKHDHIQGPSDAPMTLLEYGDYECPYCGEAHPVVKAVQAALGDRLRFVYRNFPLENMHPHAEHAAEAAEAAGKQGHFWEMHDTLYDNQEALEDEDLADYATELDLDARRLIKEVETEAYQDRIREDFRGGVKSGVNGTPSFFVNGLRYDGPQDPEAMVDALNQTSIVER